MFLLMTIIGLFFVLTTLATTLFSLYKSGRVLRKKRTFAILSLIALFELFITFAALPTNLILKKSIIGILMALLSVNLFLFLLMYKKNFNSRRLMLGIISIMSSLALFTF